MKRACWEIIVLKDPTQKGMNKLACEFPRGVGTGIGHVC